MWVWYPKSLSIFKSFHQRNIRVITRATTNNKELKEILPKDHKIMLDKRENKDKEERIGHREDWTGRKGDKVKSTYSSKEDK